MLSARQSPLSGPFPAPENFSDRFSKTPNGVQRLLHPVLERFFIQD